MESSFRIGDWLVEPLQNRLVRGETRVKLDPKVMRVLLYLAERPNEVAEKEKIIESVWEGAFVTDEVLTNAIFELRKAFGDDAKEPKFIQTVPKKGYRLIASVGEPEGPQARRSNYAAVIALLAALVALGVIGVQLLPPKAVKIDTRAPRFQLSLPRGVNILPYINFNVLAISPDGSNVAFVGCLDESRVDRASGCRLYIRDRSSIDARPLADTEGAESPFFSPDGRKLAFGAKGKLKKIDLDSGIVVALTDAPVARGGSWGEDETLLFSRGGGGILRVSADGGEVQELTKPDRTQKEYDHRWPQILPGGRAALFEVLHEVFNAGSRGHDIAVVDLETGTWRILVESGGTPRYAAGHVLFGRDGVLYAAPLDLERLQLTGKAVPVLEGVFMWSSPGENSSFAGNVSYDISRDGALLFVPREARLPKRRLVLLGRDGRFESLSGKELAYSEPHFSPDGRRIAVAVEQDVASWDAFVVDLASDAWTRVASDARPMAWTPDGKLLLSARGLSFAGVDGSESVESLYAGDASMVTVSREGSVLFSTQAAPGLWDIWRLNLQGERNAEPWLATSSWEQAPTFSPDGGFVAYHSDASGSFEIVVGAFSGAGGTHQVSNQGGLFPRWSRDGREIFFLSQGCLWSAAVRTTPTFASDPPRKLFELAKEIRVQVTDFYDVSPDSQHFVMVEKDAFELRPLDIVIIPAWIEEMKTRVASAK